MRLSGNATGGMMRDYVYVDRDFLASQEPEAVALREKMFERGEKLRVLQKAKQENSQI